MACVWRLTVCMFHFQARGIDVGALTDSTSVPPLTYAGAETLVALESKSVALNDHWTYLDRTLDRRVALAELFVDVHVACERLDAGLAGAEPVVGAEARARWTCVLQLYDRLKNVGEKYLDKSARVSPMKKVLG